MILDFLLVAIFFYMSIPAVCGYCARSYGRSFTKWFILGMLFPVVTQFVLFFLINNDKKRQTIQSMLKLEEVEYMEQQIDELGSFRSASVRTSPPDQQPKLTK